ncbi:hypothetical protein CAC42_7736 [Sphaceloma murrayae]|uniref:Uncharacterized protein n=1 Tax=Sphaceloma murrayae TaxID=2082308 RepID=A0A2K1QXN0_9PEZI|nr:hypothetical protein CAC42_7736 [Sphaceloma murrayae]
MSASIAQVHGEAINRFEQLCLLLGNVRHAHTEELQDEYDRYDLWAGNVGAMHSGRTWKYSLDYRLRENEVMKDQYATDVPWVSSFLAILNDNLERALSSVATPSLQGDDQAATQMTGNSSDEDDDSPWDISSDDSASVQGVAGTPSSGSLHARRSADSRLQSRLSTIRRVIGCLYKLPIRTPAPLDRLKDRTVDDAAVFYPYDLAYVRDKFPTLQDEVVTRLAKMITRRRQLLEYRKRHQVKLSVEQSSQRQTKVQLEQSGPENKSEAASRSEAITSKATTMRPRPQMDATFALISIELEIQAPTSIAAKR